MRKDLLVNGMIIVLILGAAFWLIFTKPVKLGLDLKGGVSVGLEAQATKDAVVNPENMQRLVDVVERRVNSLGVTESTVQLNGKNRVLVELPGIKDREEAIKVLGKMALLEFKLVENDNTLGPAVISGKDIKGANLSFSQGRPGVALSFTPEGSKKFAKITSDNVGRKLAITLDGKVQSSPNINQPILDGQASITGSFSVETARSLAALLNAGALPLKVKIVETREVGATLGNDSIHKSFKAGILALILIGVFMIIWYRLPGIISVLALAIFGVIAFGGLQFFDATLTLPGIAGFILSVGMAVDANVIIFERIKDELRIGNSVLNSVENGSKKAFITIFDSNITTLIITAILFFLGTGPVKGFGITLAIGILSSMLTNVWISNIILKEFVRLFKINRPGLFGVKEVK